MAFKKASDSLVVERIISMRPSLNPRVPAKFSMATGLPVILNKHVIRMCTVCGRVLLTCSLSVGGQAEQMHLVKSSWILESSFQSL